VPTPQRSARLYRGAVDAGLASAIGGAVLPTEQPFLYYIWATVAEGQTLASVEGAILAELERVARDGITEAELAKVRAQLRARFVYDSDSVTDIAHQLGYFQTIASWRAYHALIPRLATVTLDQVNAAARRYLGSDNRTIGWFEPEAPAVAADVVSSPAA
jgi:zinc protease